jgi:hypothetical protein
MAPVGVRGHEPATRPLNARFHARIGNSSFRVSLILAFQEPDSRCIIDGWQYRKNNDKGDATMATVEQVRDAMHRAPFLGFDIRLVDGRSYHVRHPDFLSVPEHPRGRELLLQDASGRSHRIDLLLVVEIDEPPVPEAGGASPNGAGV